MHRLTRGLVAAALCSVACAAPASASAATVTATIRVEGEQQTLLPTTTVTLDPSATVHLTDADCPGNSVAAAIDQATHGNWDRSKFTSTILGETHTFSHNDYWAEWVDDAFPQSTGICDTLLAGGDRALMLVDVYDNGNTVFPIELSGLPSAAALGRPVTATVMQYDIDGNPSPLAGATVSGGGASAVTDAAGHATVTLSQAGPVAVRAVAGSERSGVATVCVHDGDDGTCGTAVPGAGPAPVQVAAPSVTAVRDTTPPRAAIAGLRDGARFRRRHGPRLLHGTVAETGGVLMVKLRLERRVGRHCWYFSGRFERFRGARCGVTRGEWFKIGDGLSWSYLLPKRLPRGAYVLDVNAIDRSYNRDDARRPGANEVRFRVR